MNTSQQRLMRSRQDKMLGGVAGGLGNYLNVDPIIVRVVFVLLTLINGVGLLAYLVLWVVMPMEPRLEEPTAAPRNGRATGNEQAERNQAFVAAGSTPRRSRFDPMTGEPLDPSQEIPVQNLNTGEQDSAEDVQARRSRLLGLMLLALGAFFILKMILPASIMPFLLPALLIGVGVFILQRSGR
jgi:phage shock protein C